MKRIVFTCMLAVAALGCVKENGGERPAAETVTLSATLSDAVKVSFAPGTDASGNPILTLTWAENDKIRVYDHANHARYSDFTLKPESVGQKTGHFSGTALQASSYDIEVLNGATDLSAQTQPSDGGTGDLKYLASAEDVASYGTVNFSATSGVLLLRAKLPSSAIAAGVKSMDIAASEALFHDNGVNGGKTLSVSLTNAGDAGADAILSFYAALPVGNKVIPDGTTLLVHFNAPGTAHTVYTRYVELPAMTFAGGKLNQIDVNAVHADQWAGYSDTGEKATPYLIADKYQMDAMRNLAAADVKTYFKLVDDVDLDGGSWTPIDASSAYVNLNGNHHTLNNFTVTGTTVPTGLFSRLNGQVYDLNIDGAVVTSTTGALGVLAGNLGDGGTEDVSVKNVTLTHCTVGDSGTYLRVSGILAGNINRAGTLVKDVTVSASSNTSPKTGVNNNMYIGGLVGYAKVESTLLSCRVSGCTITGRDIVGGLAGGLGNNNAATCINCFVDGGTVIDAGSRRVGGLVGMVNGGTVSRCGVEDGVSVTSSSYDVAGLVGIASNVFTLENSYSKATVKGSNQVGGLIGRLYGAGSVANCFAAGTLSTSGAAIGGLVGSVEAAASVSKCISWHSSLELQGQTTSGGSGALFSDCYTKSGAETGTVSSHAQESARNWSSDIWNFQTPFPTLTDNNLPDTPEENSYDFLVVPYPASLTPGEGVFNVLVSGNAVYLDSAFGGEGSDVADQIAGRLGVSRLATSGSGEATGINLLRDGSLGEEAYELSVTSSKVVVSASTRTGLFYAWQTLRQLLPTDVYGSSAVTAGWVIPCVEIADQPRFSRRGFSMDCSRHFFTVAEVKKYLDLMAIYKMNVFHWGLTNDQGWRIQIDAYPELTHTGGYREDTPAYPGSDRNNGFYTKAQVAEIVQYAADRCITVMPEINMPGHFMAALASYPQLGCTGSGYHVWTVMPATLPDVLCLGKYFDLSANSTLIKTVLDEVMAMFPDSEYIHIGGDEVLQRENNMVKWHTCPDCTAKMNELGLVQVDTYTPETRFQYTFAKEIREYIASKGKKAICWQEAINDWYDLGQDSYDFSGGAIQSWTSGSAGLKAARNGIDAVMSPSFACYFDIAQTGTAGEPGSGPVNGGSTSNGGTPVTLNKAYDWNPVWNLTASEQTHVKGVECAMWTEFITTPPQLEYMLLPRLAATSEVGWTPQAAKDYDRFTSSLTGKHFALYSQLGYNYRSTQDF